MSYIFEIIKKNFLNFFIVAAISGFIGGVTSFAVTPKYTSQALIKVDSAEDQGLLGGLNQYSGLANIAGIGLPGANTDINYVVERLNAKDFFKPILEDDYLLPRIFSAKSFDFQTGEILFDKNYDATEKKWKREQSGLKKSKPNYVEAHKELMKDFSVQLDLETDFIKVSYSHVSPYFAKSFLEKVLNSFDEVERSNDIDESKNALIYLETQIQNSKLSEIKDAASKLAEEQVKIQMLSNVKENYKISIIDEPFEPFRKSSPNRIGFVLIFSFLACLLYLVRLVLREE